MITCLCNIHSYHMKYIEIRNGENCLVKLSVYMSILNVVNKKTKPLISDTISGRFISFCHVKSSTIIEQVCYNICFGSPEYYAMKAKNRLFIRKYVVLEVLRCNYVWRNKVFLIYFHFIFAFYPPNCILPFQNEHFFQHTISVLFFVILKSKLFKFKIWIFEIKSF